MSSEKTKSSVLFQKAKLTIELVPATAWYTNVRSNVSKSEWDRLRKIVYAEAGYKCEICGGKGSRWPVECHEIWSYDDENHTQTLERLTALCPMCHKVKHIGRVESTANSQEKDRVYKHLSRVNGWAVADAFLYAEACFEVWARRSRHQWTLDTSALEKYKEEETW